MHPLIEQCRQVMDSADPEPVLAVIDEFGPDQPDASDQLALARELLPRKHYQAVETLLWKTLCLSGDRFPAPRQIDDVVGVLREIPSEYVPSPRVTPIAELLQELPPETHELFRRHDRLRRPALLAVAPRVSSLVRIVETRALYPKDSPGAGWAPIHAIRLLGELQAPESVSPMVRGLKEPEIFDYALKELAFALGRMGAIALDATTRALEAPGLDEFQIITMLRILRDAAIVDELGRARVLPLLLQIATNEEQPPEVRAFAVRYLVEMNAREHAPIIEALLDDPLFTRGMAVSPARLRDEFRASSVHTVERRKQSILARFAELYPER